MSNYRVKHFGNVQLEWLENEVNEFIKNNNIEVLKYTLHPHENEMGDNVFLGVLEYEELDHET